MVPIARGVRGCVCVCVCVAACAHVVDCTEHCPSGNDPMTDADETDCSDKQNNGADFGTGQPGNLCHVDCANRGLWFPCTHPGHGALLTLPAPLVACVCRHLRLHDRSLRLLPWVLRPGLHADICACVVAIVAVRRWSVIRGAQRGTTSMERHAHEATTAPADLTRG